MSQLRGETFPALMREGCRHVFLGRAQGIDVATERAAALARLSEAHREARRVLGFGDLHLLEAEQVHGKDLAVFIESDPLPAGPSTACDGLLTNRRDACLAIYVADCCAVYLFDPRAGAIGLVHSGKKGSELGIAAAAVAAMTRSFGSRPEDIIVQLSPCIRPPFYEVDFAARIIADCRAAGVREVHDCGSNTAADPSLYYSYRMEKGRTGRMLALLALL